MAYRALRLLAVSPQAAGGHDMVSSGSEEEGEDARDTRQAAVAAPGAPEPATQDEEVNQELLAVLAAMFRDRVPLFLALVPAHEQRVMDLFRQDEERFRSARTTATLTMYIEEGLSYRSITKINELFKPLADMLGSPRLFASIGEVRAAFHEFQAEYPITDSSICEPPHDGAEVGSEQQRGRAAISLDAVQIAREMWRTKIIRKVMCPYLFGDVATLLWVFSLDARNRGKLHETIGSFYCVNSLYNVLSYNNAHADFICSGKEEDKTLYNDGEVAAYSVLFKHFENMYRLRHHEFMDEQGVTVRNVIRTSYGAVAPPPLLSG